MDSRPTVLRELTARDLEAVNGGGANLVDASFEYLIGLASRMTKQDHQDELALMQDVLGKLKHSHWPPAALGK
jgi:hypothetical protein